MRKRIFELLLLSFLIQTPFALAAECVPAEPPRRTPWVGRLNANSVLAASAPDNAYDILRQFYGSAKKSILISVYQIDNDYIGDLLDGALSRGVKVRILLEGAPIPKIPLAELYIADRLIQKGAEIRFYHDLEGRGHRLYRYLHNKYGVVDGERVIVGSANYGTKGHPVNSTEGNREWMVAIDDPRAARLFSEAFAHDSNICEEEVDYGDGERFTFDDPSFEPNRNAKEGNYRLQLRPVADTNVPLQTVFAPDNSLARENSIFSLLASAKDSLDIEQLNFETYWGGPTKPYNPTLEDSPFLTLVFKLARQGVQTRILLNDDIVFRIPRESSSFLDPALTLMPFLGSEFFLGEMLDEERGSGGAVKRDNEETVRVITEAAERQGLPLEARLLNFRRCGLVVMHNKGVIVDASSVLVGSLNWGESAMKFNREAGVMLHSEKIANYFGRAFDYDWNCSERN